MTLADIFMYIPVHVYVLEGVCMCIDQRLICVCSSIGPLPYFLRLNLKLIDLAKLASQQALRVVPLYLPSTGISGTYYYIQLLREYWGSNSGTRACPVVTLQTKPSL